MRVPGESRLILVEGLPGTGKTTHARAISKSLEADHRQISLFLEGDLHPVDLQWISRVSPQDYRLAAAELHAEWLSSAKSEPWSAIAQRLDDQSTLDNGKVLTAYTRLDFIDVELWDALDRFRSSEVHGGRVSIAEYCDIYLRRWQQFGAEHRDDETTFILECAFFQSHITELLGYHLIPDQKIVSFLRELIEPVRALNPEIHYIKTEDYPHRIQVTAETRDGWLNDVISWVEASPYGQEHELQGFDGAMQFFRHRKEIELQAMRHLDLPVHTIER